MQESLTSNLSSSAKEALREWMRTLLPEIARKVIDEEIQRIRAEEMALPQGEELSRLIREAFTPRVEHIAREMIRDMARDALPVAAERLVREEIEKIKNNK
ncbi:MAG: hypothetical protein HQM03_19470 [Magnetococcales bacterium]|nr:hypothetical protein [Magnetococcales bacterium]